MDSSRRAVEAYWRSRMIDGVTSDEDKVAPVYKLEEVCDLLRTSHVSIVKEVSDYILKRLDHKSPIVKQKALRLIKYAVGKSGADFRKEMQRHSAVMRQLFHYKGHPDPLKGDALNKAVRDTAHEAITALFADANNESKTVIEKPTENIQRRIEGFGNTNYEVRSEEKKSFLSEVVDIGLNTIAAASSLRKTDNVGSYRSPNIRRSLTTETSNRDRYERNEYPNESYLVGSSSNTGSGTWGQDLRTIVESAVNSEDASSCHVTPKSREERLLETIVTSGGVRLQPTRAAIQTFLMQAVKLDPLAMSRALEMKLQSPLWKVRMKACCVLGSILSIPGIVKIKDQYNPATWMLEVSSTAIEVKLYINFAEVYRSSSLFKRNNEIVDALREPVPGIEDLHFPTQYAQSNYEQFKSCLWKQMLTYWRSPDYNMTRFLFSWSSAFILGSMFWNVGKRRESSSDIVMTLGAMFAAVLFAGFQNAATVQPVVATERTVFYREKAAGMYSGLPYAFAQMAMEIPYVFIQTVFYVLIIYSMFGLEWAVDKFFWFFFVAFFTFLYFTYYGMMFVAISPNVQVAGLLCATFFTLFNLFCGFFIPKAKIPKWWVWYYWVDPVQWTINGLITTQFGDLEDMITVPGQSSQSIKSYIGDQFGLHLDFMYAVALVLVGFTLLFAFVFAFGIKKLNFQQR